MKVIHSLCKCSLTLYMYLFSTKPQTMHVSGAHNSPVTCLEWSPDGELLYSGDEQGKVYVTVIKIREVNKCNINCAQSDLNKVV